MNALTASLRILGQHKPFPSIDDYNMGDQTERAEIYRRWENIGRSESHPQRDLAWKLYCEVMQDRCGGRPLFYALDLSPSQHVKEADYDGDLGQGWRDSI